MDGMSVNGITSGRSLSEHKNPNLLLLDKHTSLASTPLFAHSAFIGSFEPQDVGHLLLDSNCVNVMHEELQNRERN